MVSIRKEALGEKHPDYAKSLNILAEMYRNMGDYAKAEPLYRQACAIDKEVLVRLLHFMRPSRPRFPVVVGFFGTLARGGPMSKPVAVC